MDHPLAGSSAAGTGRSGSGSSRPSGISGYDYQAEHEARLRGHQLANLQLHWGEAYDITWQDGMFRAARRDGGGLVFAGTYSGLYELVSEDYANKPVPPSPEYW